MLKRVTECRECALCAVRLGFGFIGADTMACTLSGVEVEDGDGCTMGEDGEPSQAVEPYDVDAPNLNDYRGFD